MQCKFCKAENAEGAKFCKNCGKSLTEQRVCGKCGAKLEDDAQFCPACGTKTDQAPAEETASVAAATDKPVERKEEAPAQKPAEKPRTYWKKWVSFAGAITGCICAILSVIFFFLVTLGIKTNSEAIGSQFVSQISIENIISQLQQEFAADSAWKLFDESVRGAYVVGNILPLIMHLAVWGIFALVIFIMAVLALCKYLAIFKQKVPYNGADKTVYTIYFLYIAYVLFVKCLWSINISGGSNYITYAFDSTTTTGLALASCFLIVTVATRVAVAGKQLANIKKIFSLVFCSAIVVCSAVALSYFSGAIFGYGQSSEGITSSGYSYTMAFFPFVKQTLTVMIFNGDISGVAVLSVLGTLFVFGVVAMLLVNVYNALCEMTEGYSANMIGFSVGSLALAVPVILIANSCAKKLVEDMSYNVVLSPMIAGLIAAVIALVFAITDSIVKRQLVGYKV